jgi:hypothetical protein
MNAAMELIVAVFHNLKKFNWQKSNIALASRSVPQLTRAFGNLYDWLSSLTFEDPNNRLFASDSQLSHERVN